MAAETEKKPKSYSEGYRDKFMSMFPVVVSQLISPHMNDPQITESMQHLKEALEYNVPKGKCNRGLMVIGSLCHLLPHGEMTEELERKALILGWCVEWLQAFCLVADDIMDQSITRRGQPCWYRQNSIGLMAINDAFLIESTLYRILRNNIKQESYYSNVIELFHEVTYMTEVGQCLDLLTSPSATTTGCPADIDNYNMTRYQSIVKYKTAFYSFYLPVAIAMYMAGISDESAHTVARNILLPMGEYFQIQDDFLDCYGDPAVTGKVGTDIEECKCSWLVVQALERVDDEQRVILKANYGINDPACIQTIKSLYRDLNLEQLFHDYEETSYQRLMETIDSQLQNSPLPRQLFVEFADRIYKRKK